MKVLHLHQHHHLLNVIGPIHTGVTIAVHGTIVSTLGMRSATPIWSYAFNQAPPVGTTSFDWTPFVAVGGIFSLVTAAALVAVVVMWRRWDRQPA